jgi:hypothetical protein
MSTKHVIGNGPRGAEVIIEKLHDLRYRAHCPDLDLESFGSSEDDALDNLIITLVRRNQHQA